MQPNIIYIDKLNITGLTGDGRKTGKIWNKFDSRYNKKPFPKADENGYEIRFEDGAEIFVGFAAESADTPAGFQIIALPATEYAVFDVHVANGYESRNAEIDQWLADNAARYEQCMLNGAGYVVLCYSEKFKGGNQPDSIVEIWVPVIEK